MKRSKNMFYKMTVESEELMLYSVNDYDVYRYTQSVINTLKKHVKKGDFDRERAIDAFYHVSTYSAKLYCKEFCEKSSWNIVFDVTARYTVAIDMLKYYREDIQA